MIVCGTDFTGAAFQAARAAAAIAARLRQPLKLVHVLDFPLAPEAEPDEASAELSRRAREIFRPEIERRSKLLEGEAARLSESGARIEPQVVSGAADEALIALARECQARLLVIASLGRRSASSWRLGSVADRLALTTPIPLLVVRDARPFEVWSSGDGAERELSVLLGIDFGHSADAAAAWTAELKSAGPCRLMAAHVYDPEREARRLGLELPPGSTAELQRALGDIWQARVADQVGEARLLLRALPRGAHAAETLVELAESERADLIVVGSHQRKGFSRHWHRSVSYSILPLAATNVAVVPAAALERPAAPVPRLQRLLAVPDLSAAGHRAVGHAFALAPRGARVVLLHVVLPPVAAASPFGGYLPVLPRESSARARDERALEAQLQALVPLEAADLDLETRVELAHASDVAEAVCQAVERHSSDLVCMATHAHGAVASALLGSAAQGVVRRCGRPVLLVGPAHEG